MPKFVIARPLEDSKKISAEDQQVFQSGVGMLLYFIKYKRPDIANMMQELSKVNDDMNPAAFCELLHVIKYILKTKHLGFKLESFRSASSNSDYAGDTISRRSVSSFTLFVLCVPVSWLKSTDKHDPI